MDYVAVPVVFKRDFQPIIEMTVEEYRDRSSLKWKVVNDIRMVDGEVFIKIVPATIPQ